MLSLILILVTSTSIKSVSSQSKPCALKNLTTGLICVCNSSYCDTLEFNLPTKPGEALIFSSSKSGLRFNESNGIFKFPDFFQNIFSVFNPTTNIVVDRGTKFQTMIGFGGAFTGAVSYNINLMSTQLQEHVYKSYYSKDTGIGYNMMRIPIGGSDFDLVEWTYNEYPVDDKLLSNFTKLDDRDLQKVQQINNLMNLTKNNDIKFVGAAWSPPKWMKSNNAYSGLSLLKSEYYQTWADYHVKFLELMAANGIDFWAISTGNEPLSSFAVYAVSFMTLGWEPVSIGRWLVDNLAPAMKSSAAAKNVKILASDDQRFTLPAWIVGMNMGSPNASQLIDGIAVHWYQNRISPIQLLDLTHDSFPDKFILQTESSTGFSPLETRSPILGSWERAEDYIFNIMDDFLHHVTGWIDWNLILNENGGPNNVNNFVDAAIISFGGQIYKQPLFYGLGHFSRFIIEGSVRIKSESPNQNIKVVAFLRPDDYVVIIAYNLANSDQNVNFSDGLYGNLQLTLPSKSIHTIVYK